MIKVASIYKTAISLMEKAAIEIPDDYLKGLKRAAKDEDGDLSNFVLAAMLENSYSAQADKRAVCG